MEEKFCQTLVGLGYIAAFPGAQKTFKNSATGIRIEIITTGEFPGDGKPKAVSFPNPQEVAVELGRLKVINLKSLIELKLASGLSAPDRLKDLADIARRRKRAEVSGKPSSPTDSTLVSLSKRVK